MAGSCCPSATATETRRCPTTRARPFRGRMDDCIRSRRPASRDARRACRGTGEPLLRASKAALPYTLQPQNRAARDEGVAHTLPTHYERDATRPAREKRTAHFKFVCDRAPSNCAEPGSRRGRRHGLQLDGDGAVSRRRYGGGRVYMELTIDGRARRPAQRGSFDIKAPRPGSVCNTASIIRDARAPRNNPRAGTTRGTTSSHLGILGSNKPHLGGPLGHRFLGSGLTIGSGTSIRL